MLPYHLVQCVTLIAPYQLIKHDFVGSSCRTIDIVYSLPSRHIWFSFVGNEEIRDASASFAENHNAALVFVTDEHTEKYLKISLNTLRDKGAERIKVLPLFISTANPRYQLARSTVTSAINCTYLIYPSLW